MNCGQKMVYKEKSNIEQNRYPCNRNFLYTGAIQEIQYKQYKVRYKYNDRYDNQYTVSKRNVQQTDDNDSTTVA